MERLALPTTRSPLVQLEEDIQNLNLRANLTPEERWNEYEKIFKTFFAWKPPGGGVVTTTTKAFAPEPPPPPAAVPGSLPTSTAAPTASSSTENEFIIDALPTTIKERGRQLLKFIKHTPDLTSGNLTFDNLQGEAGNLFNLIHYAVRQRRKKHGELLPPPTGWDKFLKFLRRNNVPDSLLTLAHRQQQRHRPTSSTRQRLGEEKSKRKEKSTTTTHKGSPIDLRSSFSDLWWNID